MLLSHGTAAGMNVHRFFPASFQVPGIWRRVRKEERGERRKKNKRREECLWLSGSVGRLSGTPAVTEPWIRKAGRKKEKETDPISSLREHDRGIKAILKFNGPCRFPSTCNLSQAARSIRRKEPVLELYYTLLLLYLLQCCIVGGSTPTHECVSFVIFGDQTHAL